MTATLALAIGANAAVFGLVDAALLRRLPLPEDERLVPAVRSGGVQSPRARKRTKSASVRMPTRRPAEVTGKQPYLLSHHPAGRLAA